MKISKMQQRVNDKASGVEIGTLGKTWEKLLNGSRESAEHVNNIYIDITLSIKHMLDTMQEFITNDYAERINNILASVQKDCEKLNSEMERILSTHVDKKGIVTGKEDEDLYFTATVEYSRCIENMQNIIVPLSSSVSQIALELAERARNKLNQDKESELDVNVITEVEFKEEK